MTAGPFTSSAPEPAELIDRLDYQLCERLLATPEHLHRLEIIARKYIKGTTVTWEDARQVAQERVIYAIRSGGFRQGGIAEFHRWAAAIARYAVIDLVRADKSRYHYSLDQTIPGTNVSFVHTLADDLDLQAEIERANLITSAIAAIASLDARYPERAYLAIWNGRVAGKNQSQIAAELKVHQGTVSKRWKELMQLVAQELDLSMPTEATHDLTQAC